MKGLFVSSLVLAVLVSTTPASATKVRVAEKHPSTTTKVKQKPAINCQKTLGNGGVGKGGVKLFLKQQGAGCF